MFNKLKALKSVPTIVKALKALCPECRKAILNNSKNAKEKDLIKLVCDNCKNSGKFKDFN